MIEQLDIEELLGTLATRLRPLIGDDPSQTTLAGIHAGGVWVARQLVPHLPAGISIASLDVSFFRDDYDQRGLSANVQPSNLPTTIDGQHIILVDDVLFTGRTVRAAMNLLFDCGRPRRISLAVLVDRGGRELPVQADAVGHRIEIPSDRYLRLSGPDPLTFRLEPRA